MSRSANIKRDEASIEGFETDLHGSCIDSGAVEFWLWIIMAAKAGARGIAKCHLSESQHVLLEVVTTRPSHPSPALLVALHLLHHSCAFWFRICFHLISV